jgi:hypothetical protein
VLFILGCKKYIPDEYPHEIGCEKFSGIYEMYDPVADSFYIMKVSCTGPEDNNSYDTIYFDNFANKFNFHYKLSYYVDDPFFIAGTIKFPLEDKFGKKWSFSNWQGYYSDSTVNRLVGDSLFINFSISNIAFYVEDGVPYEACEDCGHTGIKTH